MNKEDELREALERLMDIGCWERIYGTEDWRCRWCHMVKVRAPVNEPHDDECEYMMAKKVLA